MRGSHSHANRDETHGFSSNIVSFSWLATAPTEVVSRKSQGSTNREVEILHLERLKLTASDASPKAFWSLGEIKLVNDPYPCGVILVISRVITRFTEPDFVESMFLVFPSSISPFSFCLELPEGSSFVSLLRTLLSVSETFFFISSSPPTEIAWRLEAPLALFIFFS